MDTIPRSVSSRYWRCAPIHFVEPKEQKAVYVPEALGGYFVFTLATGGVVHAPGTRKDCRPPQTLERASSSRPPLVLPWLRFPALRLVAAAAVTTPAALLAMTELAVRERLRRRFPRRPRGRCGRSSRRRSARRRPPLPSARCRCRRARSARPGRRQPSRRWLSAASAGWPAAPPGPGRADCGRAGPPRGIGGSEPIVGEPLAQHRDGPRHTRPVGVDDHVVEQRILPVEVIEEPDTSRQVAVRVVDYTRARRPR